MPLAAPRAESLPTRFDDPAKLVVAILYGRHFGVLALCMDTEAYIVRLC